MLLAQARDLPMDGCRGSGAIVFALASRDLERSSEFHVGECSRFGGSTPKYRARMVSTEKKKECVGVKKEGEVRMRMQ